MNLTPTLRAALIWFAIAVLAVLNGWIRDTLVAPALGMGWALPLSGIFLSVIVFAATWFAFGFLRLDSRSACVGVGVQWVLMTLVFELIVGQLVGDKPWSEWLKVFDLAGGNLFLLVLLACLLSPCIVTRFKESGR